MSMSAAPLAADPLGACETVAEEALHTSLWGQIGACDTLEVWDLGSEDGTEPIAVEEVVEQLVHSGQQDSTSVQSLLVQLCGPAVPPYAIIGCESWLQLIQLLPHWLVSCLPCIAAAAEELLLKQLAPELLHCSPDPLTQVLTALLKAVARLSSSSSAAAVAAAAAAVEQPTERVGTQVLPQQAHANGPEVPAAAAGLEQPALRASVAVTARTPGLDGAHGAATGVHCLTLPVTQFILTGLQKLGRQWHFLDPELSQDLCQALVAVMLQPVQLITALQDTQPQLDSRQAGWQRRGQQQQQLVPRGSHQAPNSTDKELARLWQASCLQQQQQDALQQQQQQQGASQQQQQWSRLLALQLLQYEPSLSWWHRLVANNVSSRTLKAAAVQQGLLHELLRWVEQHNMQLKQHEEQQQQQQQHAQQATHASSVDVPKTAVKQQLQLQQQQQLPDDVSASGDHASSSSSTTTTTNSMLLQQCLAVHLLASFVGTPSGRQQLLQAAAGLQQQEQQQQILGQQHQQRQPQDDLSTMWELTVPVARACGVAQQERPYRACRGPACCEALESVITHAVACLTHWAQGNVPQGCVVGHNASDRELQGHVGSTPPLQPGAAVQHRPAVQSGAAEAAATTNRKAVLDSSIAASPPSTPGTILQSAVASAAWAVDAYEEQQLWLEGA